MAAGYILFMFAVVLFLSVGSQIVLAGHFLLVGWTIVITTVAAFIVFLRNVP